MSSFTQKWSKRTADLRLPRPRTIHLPGLDTDATVHKLIETFDRAANLLGNPSEHYIARWDAVHRYAQSLAAYMEVLGTHVAPVDSRFLEPLEEFSLEQRSARIEEILANEATRTQGLAAALVQPTYFAAVATDLTAFAVKDNSARSYSIAVNALNSADRMFADYELLERTYS